MSKRLSGVDGYLYLGTLGSELTDTSITGEGYHKITAIGGSSGLPGGAEVGDVFYNKPGVTGASGDGTKLFTLNKLAFVTDVPNSAQKEKFEDTTQVDTARSYEESDKPEISGSLNGYFIAEDTEIETILGRFFKVHTDDGAGSQTWTNPTSGALHFFLGRYETTTVGEVEIMQYMPAIIDSIQMDKPMMGKQTFSCNYTVVGSEKPSIIKRTITA